MEVCVHEIPNTINHNHHHFIKNPSCILKIILKLTVKTFSDEISACYSPSLSRLIETSLLLNQCCTSLLVKKKQKKQDIMVNEIK